MEAIAIADASQVGEARRSAMVLAKRLGFTETGVGRVGIVATELAGNILKHAGAGEILIGGYEDDTGAGFECIALDKGPGMASVAACLEDGYSTSGTSGTGLGAVNRQSAILDIFSQPGRGTAILSRVCASRTSRATPLPRWGVVSAPYPGETVCGDGYRVALAEDGFSAMVVDGLGHGVYAAEASNAAVQTFNILAHRPPDEIAEAMHTDLRRTRGAAVGIVSYRRQDDAIGFAGVGNIAGAVVNGGETRRTVSHNGTVGHVARKFQTFIYAARPPFLIVLASDGLGTAWNFESYPGLQARHPTLIASVLYRDFRRKRDDVTVLIIRQDAR
jgi:anti-sigma regulatory factor (Ser/Thr protein kinase)